MGMIKNTLLDFVESLSAYKSWNVGDDQTNHEIAKYICYTTDASFWCLMNDERIFCNISLHVQSILIILISMLIFHIIFQI